MRARCCPCINSFSRASLPSHTLAFTPIAPFQYTRFHAHCGPPIHSLPITTPSSRPSLHSHTLASSFNTTLPYTRFQAHCSRILSHSCPFLSSHTLILSPIAAPQTRTLACLRFITRARAVYAHACVSACERLLQRDHAVVPGGGRCGESDDEDGAARPGLSGAARSERRGPGSRLLRCWLACEAGSKPRCCFIVALAAL